MPGWRVWVGFGLAGAASLVCAAFLARTTVRVGPIHVRSTPRAVLGPEIRQSFLEAARAHSADGLVIAALQTTGRWLRFGLGHATSMKFEGHRSGNCVEYAHLFGTGLELMAKELEIPVEVWVVRSRGARVFGVQPPGRWFADHDWVLVRAGDETIYVDPAFSDAWLGWDLRRNVVGSP